MKEISEDVVVLEREIADLNRKYRQLLPRTKVNNKFIYIYIYNIYNIYI